MKIYHYTKKGDFLRESDAKESPLEKGIYLIPARATTTPPPTVDQDEIAVFKNDIWTIEPDFRGQTYWMPDEYEEDDKGTEIKHFGALPQGALLIKPSVPTEVQEERDAEALRLNKRNNLKDQWETLPTWIQGVFHEKFRAANELLDQGKDQAAIDLINYVEPPASFNAENLTAEEAAAFNLTTKHFKSDAFAVVQAMFKNGVSNL